MHPIPTQYQAAIRLERLLGDPDRAENLFSFRQALEWDEQEQFPEPAMARLHQLGLHRIFVPRSVGGAIRIQRNLHRSGPNPGAPGYVRGGWL